MISNSIFNAVRYIGDTGSSIAQRVTYPTIPSLILHSGYRLECSTPQFLVPLHVQIHNNTELQQLNLHQQNTIVTKRGR